MEKCKIQIDGLPYYVEMTDNVTKIYDSWMLSSDIQREVLITKIKLKNANAFGKRSMPSLVSELKAHKALFYRDYKIDRTKDTDLEHKQNIFQRIGFAIVNLLFRED